MHVRGRNVSFVPPILFFPFFVSDVPARVTADKERADDLTDGVTSISRNSSEKSP